MQPKPTAQSKARDRAARADRKWQHERRLDEWDRNYDLGKLKKVKKKKNGW